MKKTAFFSFDKILKSGYFILLLLVILLSLAVSLPVSAQGEYFTKLTSPTTPSNSAGGGWIDYNNDNKLDAYFTFFNISNQLFSNNGDGTFQTLTQGDLIPSGSNFSGISWGDYDNDGYPDLYITSMSGGNALYKNSGDGHFQRITNSATTKDNGSFLSCNWIDYDNDGYIDLFVTASGTSFSSGNGNFNFLYRNNGDETFTKVTDNSLVLQKTNSNGASFADIDNDGDQDLFLTEWLKDNWLFENDGNGNFTMISSTNINSNNCISITASWGDYDNDGYLDLFVGNGTAFDQTLKQHNYLFHNNGDKTFTKVTDGDIADYIGCVWTSAWGDVDNDGYLDLYVGTIYETEELLYINNGDGTFTQKHEFDINNNAGGTGVTGACFGDYDNDGFIDLLVADANGGGNPAIFHNNGNDNHWINIACEGTISNRSAIGARVKVKATIGGKSFWQIREITGVQGFRGSNDLRVHFGLGEATIIDSLIVEWPSKQRNIQTNVSANQFLAIKETIPADYMEARFRANNTTGFTPMEVHFSDMSLCDENNPITSWSWDFDGDGIEDSNEKDPVFTFYCYEGNNYTVSLTISNGSKTETLTKESFIKVLPSSEQNLALYKNASASSVRNETNTPASKAVDGNRSTGWASAVSDTQWIQIELDSSYTIGKIVLRWGPYYGVRYIILQSQDGVDWSDLISVDNGRATMEFEVSATNAKFVKIFATQSSQQRGYTLYELEVYRAALTDVNYRKSTPSGFNLYQNYPNPFNPETIITYQVPEFNHVEIKVYDMLGCEVATLVNQKQNAGIYKTRFKGTNLSSGIYFYKIRAGNFVKTNKMVLMR
jgi:PKD repeat protein